MLEDKQRARKWSVSLKSELLIGQWSRSCTLIGWGWTFKKSLKSLWLFIWMRIYFVWGHYKDYPQSQYFLAPWHRAWWLDSLPQKKCSIFKILRFIFPVSLFFLRQNEKQSGNHQLIFVPDILCSRSDY